jgi:hypothetical protein
VLRIAGVAAGLLLAACGRNINNTEAVRQGVVDYLNSRQSQTSLDMNAMQVDVTSVSFSKDEAHATVAFRLKNSSSPGEAMSMNYTLERKGGKWVVKNRREAGSGHGGMPETPAMPPGHPPTEKSK